MTDRKDEARKEAERLIRACARRIRIDETISRADKLMLGIVERPTRLSPRKCPQTPPVLMFKGSVNEGGLTGKMHVLEFCDGLGSGTRAKPHGVERVELFVELVGEGEAIPKHPGDLSGGRPWFWASFKKNPMYVAFPVSDRPMKVVYWARWSGSNCDSGPFSRTCVGPVEGWPGAHKALPDPAPVRRRQQRISIQVVRPELVDQTSPMLPIDELGPGPNLPAAI